MAKYLDLQGLTLYDNKIKSHITTTINSQKGASNGVATLDANKKLTSSQLPALKTVNGSSIVGSGNISIDLSVYEIVTSLPSTGDKNKIYLLYNNNGSASDTNQYLEYVYVTDGDRKGWEKLGEYKAEIDTNAIKVSSLNVSAVSGGNSTLEITPVYANGDYGTPTTLPVVTMDSDGLMSALMYDSLQSDWAAIDKYQDEPGDNELIVNSRMTDGLELTTIMANKLFTFPSIPYATTSSAGAMTKEHATKVSKLPYSIQLNSGQIVLKDASNNTVSNTPVLAASLQGSGLTTTDAGSKLSINTSYTTTGKNYKVLVDNTSGGLYVNVPWSSGTSDSAITTAEINALFA